MLDRIYKDFQGLRIIFSDPVIPDKGFDGRNWRDDFQLTLHVQDDVRVVRPTGNIFLTNIHRVYSADVVPPSADDEDTMDYFLGTRRSRSTTDSGGRIVIVETKGREDTDVEPKMQRLAEWCSDLNRLQSDVKYDFVYVDEASFKKFRPTSFQALLDGFTEFM